MADTQAIATTQVTGAKPGEKSAPSLEQMKSLAAQFESVLLGQMMRSMRESMFDKTDGDDEKSSGFSAGPLADQVYAELSLALSRAGGVGLSDALGGALTRQAAPTSALSGMLNDAQGLLPPGLQLPTGADQTTQVSSGFGMRRDPIDGDMRMHKGIDIPMPVGHDVAAADAGRVESVGDVPGYGLTVVLKHAGGVSTRYAHLSEATVKVGDDVAKGQVIAKSGNSGKTTGPHLHFEVIKEDAPIDPQGLVGR
jgi:murein DD-endopeptidase MepM/ murein hydrolase activator NlpD